MSGDVSGSQLIAKDLSGFSSEQQKGILKTYYDQSPLAAALKRKREKLAQTKGIEVKEGEDAGSR